MIFLISSIYNTHLTQIKKYTRKIGNTTSYTIVLTKHFLYRVAMPLGNEEIQIC